MSKGRVVGLAVVVAMLSVVAVGVLLARNGLTSLGEPLTEFEHQTLYRARKVLIAAAAGDMTNPYAGDRGIWREVAGEWGEHCAMCHGPAGRGHATLGAQFYPPPPDLTGASTQQLSDEELYHIIANGVRFTGMPAWSASHGSDELWRYVALVRQLPMLTAEELRGAAQAVGTSGQHHGHGAAPEAHGGHRSEPVHDGQP